METKVKECSLELIEALSNCNISKNHTGRWGVIFGNFSCTYSYMHEDKNKVLEWIRDNYDEELADQKKRLAEWEKENKL